jgi:hypothetical protein
MALSMCILLERKSSKEKNMFEVSDKASEMLKDYFKDREELPSIRLVLNEGG